VLKNLLLGMALSRRPYLFVRIGLGVIFIYAGSLKLMDPRAFARTISHYGLLPEPLLPIVAIGLPATELLAGVALIFNLSPGLYGVSGLLLLFVAVLGYGVLHDMDINCGCFGPEELADHRGLSHAFFRDLTLMGAAAFLHWSRRARDRQSLSERSAQKLPTKRRI
jgi:uncharacterized membrane protein YphA (DoxX/SURF4 family)